MPDPVTLGGKSSSVFVMEARSGFYLLIASQNPKDDLAAVAQNLKLEKVLDYSGYFVYMRSEGTGTVRAVSTSTQIDEDFYIGCTYSQ
ncbi:MAG: hypothetical protein LBI31_07150 [Zoogloeaceae bacterium]|nr:hypothetical protein [Zoogloeaceae bacterium]